MAGRFRVYHVPYRTNYSEGVAIVAVSSLKRLEGVVDKHFKSIAKKRKNGNGKVNVEIDKEKAKYAGFSIPQKGVLYPR